MKQTRNSPHFFAKEIDTHRTGAKGLRLVQSEAYHVFASKAERDAWVAEDDYKTRWDMKGRVAVKPAEGRAEYDFSEVVFHYDVVARRKAA